MTDDKRRVRYLGRHDDDPLENRLGWVKPSQDSTVPDQWLFVPDEYPDVVGYTDGNFIVDEDVIEFLE